MPQLTITISISNGKADRISAQKFRLDSGSKFAGLTGCIHVKDLVDDFLEAVEDRIDEEHVDEGEEAENGS